MPLGSIIKTVTYYKTAFWRELGTPRPTACTCACLCLCSVKFFIVFSPLGQDLFGRLLNLPGFNGTVVSDGSVGPISSSFDDTKVRLACDMPVFIASPATFAQHFPFVVHASEFCRTVIYLGLRYCSLRYLRCSRIAAARRQPPRHHGVPISLSVSLSV